MDWIGKGLTLFGYSDILKPKDAKEAAKKLLSTGVSQNDDVYITQNVCMYFFGGSFRN